MPNNLQFLLSCQRAKKNPCLSLLDVLFLLDVSLPSPAAVHPALAGRSRLLTLVGAATRGPRAQPPSHALFLFCLHWEMDTYLAAQLREMLRRSRGPPPGELGMEKGIRGKCWGSPGDTVYASCGLRS